LETRLTGRNSSVASAACLLFAYHEMGYACAEALLNIGAPIVALFTHADTPGEEIWWRSCADLARSRSIPVHTPEAVGVEWTARIETMHPDVIYSFYYRSLLPVQILRLAPLVAFNMHGSLLPAYRGRAPVNWVLVNGERETGVTLHHMVARADAGDIVGQRAVPIDDRDTALTLYRKLVPLGAELMREFHPLIVEGRAPRLPQDLSKGSYYGRRHPEDGRIDWSWPARRVFNLVRALTHPYPGAFCFVDGRKLFIWEATIAHESADVGRPGSVVGDAPDGGIEVAAGQGSVIVARAQFELAAEGSARQILGWPAIERSTVLE
jgi:methionyl-tRNA formyltransferase